jgi:hypothetical protein
MMAPDKGLSSSFRRHVPEDRNIMPWGRPCDVFPMPYGAESIAWSPDLKCVFANIRHVTPNLIAQELCDVQPMKQEHIQPLFDWFKNNPGMAFSFRQTHHQTTQSE